VSYLKFYFGIDCCGEPKGMEL